MRPRLCENTKFGDERSSHVKSDLSNSGVVQSLDTGKGYATPVNVAHLSFHTASANSRSSSRTSSLLSGRPWRRSVLATVVETRLRVAISTFFIYDCFRDCHTVTQHPADTGTA